MSYTVTYKYSKNHPEDLFEFLEFYEKNRGKQLVDLRPYGLAFREVNEPYKKSVDLFVSNSDKTGQIVELDYTDLSDLEIKLQSFN